PVAVRLAAGGALALVALRGGAPRLSAACLAIAGALWLGETAVAATVFPVLNVAKTARPLYDRLRPSVAHGEPVAYASSRFRCYPLLVLERFVDHERDAESLDAWLATHPDGWVIAEQREFE